MNNNIKQALFDLTQIGSALHTGAHPDDEDIGVLSYLKFKHGFRTLYWSATRGEKGQNQISHNTDESLGILRTWESMDSAKINGSECLFGPFIDFGFCKTPETAFTNWNNLSCYQDLNEHDEMLCKYIVRAIRQYKPLIIISRWVGGSCDFHGHHQAVGIATRRAFDLAGNPDFYPELSKEGIYPWQPLKLYSSADNSQGNHNYGGALNLLGKSNLALEKSGFLRINSGEFDQIYKKTYQEIAWEAYSKHRSQGMGQSPKPGDFFYYLKLEKSLIEETSLDFTAGLELSLSGIAKIAGVTSKLLLKIFEQFQEEAYAAFCSSKDRIDDVDTISRHLIRALQFLREADKKLTNSGINKQLKHTLKYFLSYKIRKAEALIADVLNLRLDALITNHYMIPGKNYRVSAQLWDYQRVVKAVNFFAKIPENWQALPLKKCDLIAFQDNPEQTESADLYRQDFDLQINKDAVYYQPYWLVNQNQGYTYNWTRTSEAGQAFNEPIISIEADIELAEEKIKINMPVILREANRTYTREIYPQVILPITLTPKDLSLLILKKSVDQIVKLTIYVQLLTEFKGEVSGRLVIESFHSFNIDPPEFTISLTESRDVFCAEFNIIIPANTESKTYSFDFNFFYGNKKVDLVVTSVRQGPEGMVLPCLPNEGNCVKETFMTRPATCLLKLVDIHFCEEFKYGYIAGEADTIFNILLSIGLNIIQFSDKDIISLELSDFDAIIIGSNAYMSRDVLRSYNSRFLEFVENGGTLIVQYQRYPYADAGFTPYPFSYNMPHDRITQRNAKVDIVQPEHLVFKIPNMIEESDFDNWVIDRGLYFWKNWDNNYTALLACNDEGELPKQGGLITCTYGQGTYVYTGYSFMRQIPAGVEGALRLFANIMATPKHRIIKRMKFLRNVPIFSMLDESILEKIAKTLFERFFEYDSYICHEGDHGDELYIIIEGKVDIIKEHKDSSRIIATKSAGDFIGEFAILSNIPRTATLKTNGKTRLFILKASFFREILAQNPEMQSKLLDILVHMILNNEIG